MISLLNSKFIYFLICLHLLTLIILLFLAIKIRSLEKIYWGEMIRLKESFDNLEDNYWTSQSIPSNTNLESNPFSSLQSLLD